MLTDRILTCRCDTTLVGRAEDDFTPLPGWAPGAKTSSDDGLVAEARVLHPALTMVP